MTHNVSGVCDVAAIELHQLVKDLKFIEKHCLITILPRHIANTMLGVVIVPQKFFPNEAHT
jgi:hypothetical protein